MVEDSIAKAGKLQGLEVQVAHSLTRASSGLWDLAPTSSAQKGHLKLRFQRPRPAAPINGLSGADVGQMGVV